MHGITRDEARAGLDEPEALERFLDYLRDGVIVGHHIGHDIGTLDAGYEREWGFQLKNRSLDTMDLTLHLERDGAFHGRPPIRHFTLDSLCEMCGVEPHDRHTASGDAFLTAQVFLRLLKLAAPSRTQHARRPLRALCGSGRIASVTFSATCRDFCPSERSGGATLGMANARKSRPW